METRLTNDLTTSEIKRIAEGCGTVSSSQAMWLARQLLERETAYDICFSDRVKLLHEAQQREQRLRVALKNLIAGYEETAVGFEYRSCYIEIMRGIDAAKSALASCEYRETEK